MEFKFDDFTKTIDAITKNFLPYINKTANELKSNELKWLAEEGGKYWYGEHIIEHGTTASSKAEDEKNLVIVQDIQRELIKNISVNDIGVESYHQEAEDQAIVEKLYHPKQAIVENYHLPWTATQDQIGAALLRGFLPNTLKEIAKHLTEHMEKIWEGNWRQQQLAAEKEIKYSTQEELDNLV